MRDGLVDEVAAQVQGHLEECARAEPSPRPGCPLAWNTPARTADEVPWEILEMPEIDLVPSGEESSHAAPFEVETTAPDSAEAEWTYAYTDDGSETETVAGTVTIGDDGEPDWTP